MNPVLSVILLGIGGGLVVAVATALILGKERARKLLGGSLSSGFAASLILGQTTFGFIALGAASGLVGWGVYLFLSRPRY
ncbi:hypothetical protein A2473_00005 [candidate division WWE3 bacterium RIFOXYC2_FULL_42_13]|uniref:Major facilitator superfamily (MFS) profile domain-containing protein n=1 Tax=candidate division WWE3 bacterium TaxID=2053526 RepID=A0A3D0ZNZ8_UNCKA|nr:MAG: hypothetical protein A2245_02250 [candidate division WWE3 bacterium RIFOXYA2_FULL_43_12]OGC65216.1 MAG: hypothetical protein A2274_00100 [candidate division WWE3 bacterium RIFOXYA12_FULL_43_11]OGC72165.1 MAG: hypothetical protein A2337_02395 [candidate division WWE3 bacterium RIFOXYB2_FULL_43_9]OGC74029.1 MAG: hypothetical protein A2473_00005 [candidate division WWE3 bacterium RIFOXYC2_FULL_42_13]OGC74354.1 MAG: hypothetical protein A2547_03990 [candidate division WWE3 bacterium RIFOXYD